MPQVTVKQAMGAAIARHQAGDLVEAENLYRMVLGQYPDLPDALHLMGILANQTQRRDLAESLLRKAVTNKPGQSVYHRDLAIVLLDAGKHAQAREELEISLSLDPKSALSHCLMGMSLRNQNQASGAIEHFNTAIALAPGFVDPLVHLGNLLVELGRPGDSIDAFTRVAELMPDSVAAWMNLANICTRVGRFSKAEAAAKKALSLDPNAPPALMALAIALKSRGDYDGAVEVLEKAIRLNPGFAEAANNLANIWKDMGRIDEARAQYQRAVDLAPEMDIFLSNLLFLSLYDPNMTLEADQALRRLWASRHAAKLGGRPAAFPAVRRDKIRVGFVSPDFRMHAVGRFMLPLLEHLDRSRFFTACYSDSPVKDEITQGLMSRVDLWVDSGVLSHEQLDERIRRDEMDILIDLSVHTAGNRLLVFARKPAPVQITWLGYCGSTGVEAMDFRFSDPHMDPDGLFEPFFNEKTLRLPTTYWCYPEPRPMVVSSPPPCASRGHTTFGCLNNFGKISAPAVQCWAEILKRAPGSRLITMVGEGSCRKRFASVFENAGIDPARIQFLNQMSLEEFFRAHGEIDIALDSFPFNGGMTSCDALWMGVPIVTLRGDRPVGRSGTSILANLGLSDLSTGDAAEYIDAAARLAGDVPRLVELRKTLRDRMRCSPLMDAARFGKDFSDLLEKAWREKQGG